MDFQDSAEEAAFRSRARNWLAANAPSAAIRPLMSYGSADEAQALRLQKAWQAKKAAAGWACIHWPSDYGGRSATPIERIIFDQEEERMEIPNAFFSIGLGMCGPTLMSWASDSHKARYLPRMLTGEEIWCQLFSEPAAGSDLAGLRMRATRDGDDWVLNGQKTWTSGAHYADFGLIVVRTDASVPKHKGLTAFFLDMRTAGIAIRPIRQVTGPADFNEVFFDQVRVPDAQRLGKVGEGWHVCLTTLMNERLSLGDVARPGFDELLRFARATRVDDRPAIEHADVRQALADWYVKSRGLRYTRFRTLSALARGKEPGPEASIIKLVSTSSFQRMAEFATDLEDMGGMLTSARDAQQADFQFAHLFAPSFRIAGGTDEILRNIIAERVLGLPPEPRVDKDPPFDRLPTGR